MSQARVSYLLHIICENYSIEEDALHAGTWRDITMYISNVAKLPNCKEMASNVIMLLICKNKNQRVDVHVDEMSFS